MATTSAPRFTADAPPPPPPPDHEGVWSSIRVEDDRAATATDADAAAPPAAPPADEVQLPPAEQPQQAETEQPAEAAETEEEEKEADPRVKDLIEGLNEAIDRVNLLQEEKERAAAATERARVVVAAELEVLRKDQRYFLAHVEPYHKARKQAAEAAAKADEAEATHESARLIVAQAHLATRHTLPLSLERASGEKWGLDISDDNKVFAVIADSPAQAAGLRIGDLVVEAEGEPIGPPLTRVCRAEPYLSQLELRLRVVRPRDSGGGSATSGSERTSGGDGGGGGGGEGGGGGGGGGVLSRVTQMLAAAAESASIPVTARLPTMQIGRAHV